MALPDDLMLCVPLYFSNASLLVLWRLGIFGRLPVFKSRLMSRPISEELFGKVRTLQGVLYVTLATAAGYLILLGRPLLLPGLLMAACMLANSFTKRRLGLKWGAPFPPFDQLDFLAGGLAGLYLSGIQVGSLLLIVPFTFFLHLGGNMIAYKLGLKDVWW